MPILTDFVLAFTNIGRLVLETSHRNITFCTSVIYINCKRKNRSHIHPLSIHLGTNQHLNAENVNSALWLNLDFQLYPEARL